MSVSVDPLTLAVIRGRLEQIADEMDTVFERMAFSPVISDAWDRADGIYSATDGSVIVQGDRGLPIFVGTMQFTVASVLSTVSDITPGDTFLVNDPFAGGTHIMDTKMVRPFFYRGELFAMLANTGHWTDLGGRVPGGFGSQASDCYQEGLRIPPVRLFVDDELNTDILAILQTNSRLPDDVMGDVDAQASALRAGETRLTELLDEHGPEVVSAVIATLRQRSADQMRTQILGIPDGTYQFTETMDNDGITDEVLNVAVDITVMSERMTIDFTRSSPPCEGPMNSVHAATVSSALVAIKHIFPDIPINSGIFEPLDFVIPESVFLNAKPPRPVAGCA
ncbi:MAG: hydantoinase B/oxoprolinase family protein, partial [Rhodococcus sp. (in: high G+C Gram-positive bacteria)]